MTFHPYEIWARNPAERAAIDSSSLVLFMVTSRDNDSGSHLFVSILRQSARAIEAQFIATETPLGVKRRLAIPQFSIVVAARLVAACRVGDDSCPGNLKIRVKCCCKASGAMEEVQTLELASPL
jgi:hypothetical protein